MKTIANRIAVIAAAAIALGTAAFGQNRMTAEIPFAFKTATGTLPAGTYQLEELKSGSYNHVVYLRNTTTGQGAVAGAPMFLESGKATQTPRLDFLCGSGGCALRAIRTPDGASVYHTPGKSKPAPEVAIVSVELKAHNAD